jgi:hypothetical protein
VKTYDRDRMVEHATRVANDQELREHARTALDALMAVYAKVQDQGAKKAVADADIASDVMTAASELRETARHVADPQEQGGRGFLKLLLLLAIVAAAVIGIRRVLESDEDEFEYRP